MAKVCLNREMKEGTVNVMKEFTWAEVGGGGGGGGGASNSSFLAHDCVAERPLKGVHS